MSKKEDDVIRRLFMSNIRIPMAPDRAGLTEAEAEPETEAEAQAEDPLPPTPQDEPLDKGEAFRRDLAAALGIDPVPRDRKMPPPGKLDLSHLRPGQFEVTLRLLPDFSRAPAQPPEPPVDEDEE